MPGERSGLDVTDDAALGGRLRLRQPRRGHRFGHDAVLLAAATPAQPGDHVVEFGAGVGLAGLAVAARVADTTITLIDADSQLVALAAENAAQNALAGRVRVLALDVAAPARAFTAAGLPSACAQRVMMNPPFNDAQRQQQSPDAGRAAAHVVGPADLPQWCKAAARLLARGGTLTLIWRADGLADVLAALGHDFGAVSVLPVYPRPDAAAIRILVNAAKGSLGPLSIRPGLALNDRAGRPAAEAEAVLRDGVALPMTGA
jgi:tRNA1(Val) A37 N6-methylase TrmN6